MKPYLAIAIFILPGFLCPESRAQDLEEVVVTATKRAIPLTKTTLSVVVVSSDEISEFGLDSLDAIGARVPNLQVASGSPGFVFMRGLGSGNNEGFEQSVGFFLNGVYFARDNYLSDSLLDVERIEVLRGPQGALLGKNTIAGAINLVPKTPTDERELSLRARLGERNKHQLEAIVSGPVSDNIAGRFVASYLDRDGYVDNTLTGKADADRSDTSARLSIRWTPSDRVAIMAGLQLHDSSVGGNATELRADDSAQFPPPKPPFPTTLQLFRQFDPQADADLNYRSSQGPRFIDQDSVTGWVNAELRVGQRTLTYLGGFGDLEQEQVDDSDFGPLDLLQTSTVEDYRQQSHELRFADRAGGSVDWMLGIYLLDSDLAIDQRFDVFGIAVPAGVFRGDLQFDFSQETQSLATFAQVDWRPVDRATITAGFRFGQEDKDGRLAVATTNMGTLPLSLAFPVGPDYAAPLGLSDSFFLPAAAFRYELSDTNSIYVAASTGYKAGGFNAIDGLGVNLRYAAEDAVNYELGVRVASGDQRRWLRASAYYTIYDDLQVSSFDGVGFVVGNAANATAKGLEIDAGWRINEYYRLGASAGYLVARYKEFLGQCTIAQAAGTSPGSACSQDLAGRPLLRAPEFTSSFDVVYRVLLGQYELKSRASINYTDEYFYNQDLDQREKQGDATRIDVRIGLTPREGPWSIALIAQNITDQLVRVGGADVPLQAGAHFARVAFPRQVDVELYYRF